MANLRANNVCGTDGRNAITGSVEFDGTGDYFDIASNSDFALGTGDFTIEAWINSSINSLDNFYRRIYMTDGPTGNAVGNFQIAIEPTTGKLNLWENGGALDLLGTSNVTSGSWNHIAACRSGTTLRLFVNGIIENSVTYSTSVTANSGSPRPRIGNYDGSSGSGDFQGFISNFRVIKGTALYTSNFIPPTKKLIRLPGTVLLCCQDNASATTEATGKTITANGNPTARKFVPQVGSDGGLVFNGVTKVNTQNYFYLPTGTTEQRDVINNNYGARGVFGGGQTPTNTNSIDYVTISTLGNAIDFGDLIQARFAPAACASNNRGLFGGGIVSPANVNTIDYITISTTSDSLDFGDLTVSRRNISSCSSSTRGIWAGGGEVFPATSNIIDYVTIASTGNAQDFGDLTQSREILSSCSSPTRGIFGGGVDVNTIDYVTIQSTGNAQDFGDLTQARRGPASCSSPTRGIFGGGQNPSPTPGTLLNIIDYVIIASIGNAIDFGDLTSARYYFASCSSQIRGIFGGGETPSLTNTMDYITISSTGNAQDFGDLYQGRNGNAACSNGHGGLG